MSFPRRSARLAAIGKGAPAQMHFPPLSKPSFENRELIPDMYVTQLSFASRWRDKDYGHGSITDWYFNMMVTTNKTLAAENAYCMPKNSPSYSFWCNRVCITDRHITFGYNGSSLYITTIDGLVQIRRENPFSTHESENCLFHPSITFEQICTKLKKHLVHIQEYEYRFNYEVPENMDPDYYCPPVFKIEF